MLAGDETGIDLVQRWLQTRINEDTGQSGK